MPHESVARANASKCWPLTDAILTPSARSDRRSMTHLQSTLPPNNKCNASLAPRKPESRRSTP